ncbi:hypothetical protein [Paenibacillus sp. W4I10]|uniref:hypothetical protein n=1 Tax=Paenibacillus sp. W4I10 TaxID=3042298 RepID=UPI0027D91046|nr:hypothetical protein [Paenibacillus sp. W4I10]
MDRLTTSQVQASDERMNGWSVNGMAWRHVLLLPDPLHLRKMRQVVPPTVWSRELLRWLSLTEVWCLNRQ